MSLVLTFWEDPPKGNESGDDFDGILEVRLKTVKQVPDLLRNMPERCTMVSLEYSGDHKRKGKVTSPTNTRRFREIWRKGQPLPVGRHESTKCPLCGSEVKR